jgi:hypothetical protein
LFRLEDGADVTVDGTVEESSIYTPATAGSYGVFRVNSTNGVKLVINGGHYPTTTDNGAFVRLANAAKNTNVEMNNVTVKNDGGLIYSAEGTEAADWNNVLKVNGGKFEHGYAVDQREGVSSKGIRCAAFTVAAGEFVNVTVDSQYSSVAEAKMGEVTFKNCTLKVNGQMEAGDEFMNAAIVASYGVKLTLQGGSISGKYAIMLSPTGQTVINNGATVSGRVADLLVYTMYEGKTSTVTGLNNATRANG